MVAGNIPGRTQTIALAIFQYNQTGREGRAWTLVAVTVLLAFASLWTAEVLARRRARRGAL
jgi:molybdate transport system permease protein